LRSIEGFAGPAAAHHGRAATRTVVRNEEPETSNEELRALNGALKSLEARVAELDAANAELANFIAATNIAIVFMDAELRVRRFTAPAAALFGLVATDIGKSCDELPLGSESQFLTDAWLVMKTQTTVERSLRIQPDRFHLRQIQPYRAGAEQVVGVVVSFVDITSQIEADMQLRRLNAWLERRVAERTTELQHSEGRIRAILDATADAVVTIDMLGRIATFNRAAERIFGYAAAEVIGEGVGLLIPPHGRMGRYGYKASLWKTYASRFIGRSHQISGRRKDGTVFPIQLSVNSVEGRGLFVGVARDMTEHKALQKEIVDVAMVEQRRIGQELHDGTQQELTGLGLLALSLSETLIRSGSTIPGQVAARVATGIEQANQRVRALARGMVPVPIGREGLMSSLAELARQTTEMHGLPCSFECRTAVEIDNDDEATHLYRIAQEGVNNATRHAKASAIWIRLEQMDGHLLLEVQDNGVGFQTPVAGGKGVGLRLMEHRCGMIGGAFTIELQADGGTCIACSVPRPDHG
jgi:PAS domain S-box-containing protein